MSETPVRLKVCLLYTSILEMVGALEKEFGLELDMSGLDVEKITVLGPLTCYVAAQAANRGDAAS